MSLRYNQGWSVSLSHSCQPVGVFSLSAVIMLENCTHQTSLLQTVVLHSETVCTLPQMNWNMWLTNFKLFSCFQLLFRRILKLLPNPEDVEQHMFQRWKACDDMSHKARHNMALTDVWCYYISCTTIVEILTITHLEQWNVMLNVHWFRVETTWLYFNWGQVGIHGFNMIHV